MKSPLNRIILILVLIVLFPALVFLAYEVNNLTDRESMLSEIYQRQLDVILFSVNQHSWDIANSWAGNINRQYLDYLAGHSQQELTDYIQRISSIHAVYFSDSSRVLSTFFSDSMSESIASRLEDELGAWLKQNQTQLKRLGRYRQSGYQKMETILVDGPDVDASFFFLLFTVDNVAEGHDAHYAAILIDTRGYIESVVLPRLADIAQEEIKMAVTDGAVGYQVDPANPLEVEQVVAQREIWLLEDAVLGIGVEGESLEQLVRGRYIRDLTLIVVVGLVLIFGVWLVYRNIRKEMNLARLKSDFVSNVSHELRTPLSLIRMFAETLEMGRVKSEEKKHEYYRIIGQETERLTHLVNNILNFSRMEAGTKTYNFKTVQLNGLVENVLRNYQFHLEDEGFQYSAELNEEMPSVSADEDAVTECLINLLQNAIKFSEEEKSITIRSGMDEHNLYIEVEDAGIGIDPSQQSKIFEKFYRVSGSLVHDNQGSGLGLALVAEILRAHRGSVTVESCAGEGSKFRLNFPMNEGADAANTDR